MKRKQILACFLNLLFLLQVRGAKSNAQRFACPPPLKTKCRDSLAVFMFHVLSAKKKISRRRACYKYQFLFQNKCVETFSTSKYIFVVLVISRDVRAKGKISVFVRPTPMRSRVLDFIASYISASCKCS